MAKCIGIIGGLGPKTAFQFAQNINDRNTTMTKIQPDLLLENLPVSDDLMGKMTRGEECQEVLDLMTNSVHKLTKAGVDLIIIPCNTVHVFIEPLRKSSAIPILNIVEEAVKACKEKKLSTVGILASNTTIKQKLYSNKLFEEQIKIVTPQEEEQTAINEIIFKINRNKASLADKDILLEIIQRLEVQGAEAVLLACTDLQQLISVKDTTVPLLDSFAILEEAVFDFLVKD